MSRPYPNTRRNAKRRLISSWIYGHFKRRGIGDPTDPISWEKIPKSCLYCHTQPNGVILQHDCRQLFTYLSTRGYRPHWNPMTRVTFSLADLWRLESQCRRIGWLGSGSHLGPLENHLRKQRLRHKSVSMRRFIRRIRRWVSSFAETIDGPSPLKSNESLDRVLRPCLSSLYSAETAIAKDVVKCIAGIAAEHNWSRPMCDWLFCTAMDLRHSYGLRDTLSTKCMDDRVSKESFEETLQGVWFE